jgi:hypothetical protein
MLGRHTNGYTPARSHVAYKACIAITTEIKSDGNIFIADMLVVFFTQKIAVSVALTSEIRTFTNFLSIV